MNCLNCKTTHLQTEHIASIEIDRCPTCGGTWLDMLELEKLLGPAGDELRLRDRAVESDSPKTPDEKRHACPRCNGTYLIKLNHLAGKNVIIDSCTVCFGNWLDGGEFNKLRRRET